MRFRRKLLCAASVIVFSVLAQALPFVLFPKAGQLPSPSGRFVVRNVDPVGAASEYIGTFHSLFLEDTARGRSRKLCDYVGVAALAWTRGDLLIMTEYLSKHTSRILVFAADGSREAVVIDKPLLTQLVPVELRPQLRENDHVFVEASEIESDTLTLRVWGYGKHDANGFRWRCQYDLRAGAIACQEAAAGK